MTLYPERNRCLTNIDLAILQGHVGCALWLAGLRLGELAGGEDCPSAGVHTLSLRWLEGDHRPALWPDADEVSLPLSSSLSGPPLVSPDPL